MVGVWRSFIPRLPSSMTTANPSSATGQNATRWVPTTIEPGVVAPATQMAVMDRSLRAGVTAITRDPKTAASCSP